MLLIFVIAGVKFQWYLVKYVMICQLLAGEKLANHELFAKLLFTDTPKMYLACTLTLAYSPNFSLSIAYTCMVCHNFPVYGMCYSLNFGCIA